MERSIPVGKQHSSACGQENAGQVQESKARPPGGSLERYPFLWYLRTSFICSQETYRLKLLMNWYYKQHSGTVF